MVGTSTLEKTHQITRAKVRHLQPEDVATHELGGAPALLRDRRVAGASRQHRNRP